jgi:hypothetical protein
MTVLQAAKGLMLQQLEADAAATSSSTSFHLFTLQTSAHNDASCSPASGMLSTVVCGM